MKLLIIICIHWKHMTGIMCCYLTYITKNKTKKNTKYFYYINTLHFLFTLRPYLFHLCWTRMTHQAALGLHGAI